MSKKNKQIKIMMQACKEKGETIIEFLGVAISFKLIEEQSEFLRVSLIIDSERIFRFDMNARACI